MGARRAGDRVDHGLRRPGMQRQHLEAVPSVDPLRRGQAGLAPALVHRRAVGAAGDFEPGERAAHRIGQRRAQLGHQDRAAPVDDAGDGGAQNGRRVGERTAPIARMVGAGAQIDDELDRLAAARAEEDRRPVGGEARPVRGDEQIGAEARAQRASAERAQPGRAHLLARLEQDLHREAEPAPRGDHRGERAEIDAVLALVVGRAAPVEPFAAAAQRPRGEPAAPPAVEAPHHIAMGIGEQGERRPGLDPLGEQEGRAAGLGVFHQLGGEAERVHGRRDLVRQIAPERRTGGVFLAGRGDRDAARQICLEPAVVEIGLRPGNRRLARHRSLPICAYSRGGPVGESRPAA